MAKDTAFWSKKTLNLRGNLVSLTKPIVMGIINTTPDSFYSESRNQNEKEVLKKAEEMLKNGVTIIDIGGYSSRPGATDIGEEEELSRVVCHVENIRKELPELYVSIDTFRSRVARAAFQSGADVINDISAGSLDKLMFDFLEEAKVPYIAMHMKGSPQTMKKEAKYENIITEMYIYFQNRIFELQKRGLKDIIIDPGFGFSKTIEQNYSVIKNLKAFENLGCPILVGVSRKSMIYKVLETSPSEALNGTAVLNTMALINGADILRVHDVKEAVETVKLFNLTCS